MYSPKPDTIQTIIFVAFAICFVYIMSIGISKFESCHKGDAELQKKKDYITTILTIAIIVPATLFGQRVFDSLTGEYTSALPMFFVALGVLSFVGSYFTFEIVTKEKTGMVSQTEQRKLNMSETELDKLLGDGWMLVKSTNNSAGEVVWVASDYSDDDQRSEALDLINAADSPEKALWRLEKTTQVEAALSDKCNKASSEKYSQNWWMTVIAMILCCFMVLGGSYIIWKGRSEQAANKAAKAVANAVQKAATPVTG